MEDDFELSENFDSKLKQYFGLLPRGWGAFWLGGRVPGLQKQPGRLHRINLVTGLYGYIVNRRAMPLFIDELKKGGTLADHCISRALKNIGCYIAGENIIKHKAGYSILQNRHVDYKDLR